MFRLALFSYISTELPVIFLPGRQAGKQAEGRQKSGRRQTSGRQSGRWQAGI